MIDPSAWDVPALARAWREAQPFPHVVMDELLPPADFAALREGFTKEPHYPAWDQIHSFLASGEPPQRAELRAFWDALCSREVLRAVAALSGKQLARAEVRGYVYLEGHYLLPHTDHRRELGRAVAFAYYLSDEGAVEGGELELFACRLEQGEVAATEPAAVVAQRPNRLVLFDVSDVSLHRVREVVRGMRASLAGWFYR